MLIVSVSSVMQLIACLLCVTPGESWFLKPAKKMGTRLAATRTLKSVRKSVDSRSILTVESFLEVLRSFAKQVGGSRPLESDDPRGLSPVQQAREMLLNARIPNLGLNRVRVTETSVAGRGLEATHLIKKGELITCYPGDILVYTPTDGVIFGNHVPAELNDVERCFDDLLDYGLSEDNDYSIIGLPELYADPSYLGHLANDGTEQLFNLGNLHNHLSKVESNLAN